MKLILAPFKQEAKLLAAIMPNSRFVADPACSGLWKFKGGQIICWNEAGKESVAKIIAKISDFSSFSSIILFGSAGSLSPELRIGELFTCTLIKDLSGTSWNLPAFDGLKESSLFTSDELVLENSCRKELFNKYQCQLVDQEASAFAEFAKNGFFQSANAYVVRFVSDTYESPPPIDPITGSFTGKFAPEIYKIISKYRKVFLR